MRGPSRSRTTCISHHHARAAAAVIVLCSIPLIGPGSANAQTLANAMINGLEMAPAGSLEQEIVNRLSWTGQYDPRDLARLARLTVLETIAMYQNTRADLRATSIGARLEGEMSKLWIAAELFSITASGPIQEPGALDRSRALIVNADRAYQEVSASLAELPGVPNRGAGHLRNLARLLPLMNRLLETIDADLNAPVPGPPAPIEAMAASRAALREQSRKLNEALSRLIQTVQAARPKALGTAADDRADHIAALERLRALAGGFDRLWDAGASDRLLATAFHPLRDRVRWIEPAMETLIEHARDGPEIAAQWREFRQAFDALSDGLGFSRVIVRGTLRPAVAANLKQGRDQSRSNRPDNLVARIDRALEALNALLSRNEADTRGTIEWAELSVIAARTRLDLLVLRQSALGGASAAALARSLSEIERSSASLRGLAGTDRRIVRGTNPTVSPELKRAAEALGRLREAPPAPPQRLRSR